MSRISDRLFDARAWRTNYTEQREIDRTRRMYCEIAFMLIEAIAVTAFLASFR